MKTAEEIHADMTRKKLREESHEKWVWLRCFGGKCHGKPVRDVIEEQLAAGKRVKAGYTCTQIRGYHDRWLLIYTPNAHVVAPPTLDSDLPRDVPGG